MRCAYCALQPLIRREQTIEFGIQVIVVRVIAVFRLPAEILPESVRRCGLSLDQSAGAPTFACSDPYALSFFHKPSPPKLTANTVESVPETGEPLAGLHKRRLSHYLFPPHHRGGIIVIKMAHARRAEAPAPTITNRGDQPRIALGYVLSVPTIWNRPFWLPLPGIDGTGVGGGGRELAIFALRRVIRASHWRRGSRRPSAACLL